MGLHVKIERITEICISLAFFALLACSDEKEAALDLVETEVEVGTHADEVDQENMETPVVGSTESPGQTGAETSRQNTGAADSGNVRACLARGGV